jgi:hypothetical protein
MPDLTIGSTVHYTDNPNVGGGHARCFGAVVTGVNPDGTVDLQESLAADGPPNPAFAVREGKPGNVYTWHWPEPVNNVHRPASLAAAHKLRSAAAVLRADADGQTGELRDILLAEADVISRRAATVAGQSLREQSNKTATEVLARARSFCSLRQDCRMADGHDGGCQP